MTFSLDEIISWNIKISYILHLKKFHNDILKAKWKFFILFLFPGLKGVCHEIFDLQFFKPIWAPDKQVKVFSN